jgi:hypothetical protein
VRRWVQAKRAFLPHPTCSFFSKQSTERHTAFFSPFLATGPVCAIAKRRPLSFRKSVVRSTFMKWHSHNDPCARYLRLFSARSVSSTRTPHRQASPHSIFAIITRMSLTTLHRRPAMLQQSIARLARPSIFSCTTRIR